MPFVVKKLPDEPIIIVRVTGQESATDYAALSARVADLIENIPGTIYRINDLTHSRRSLWRMIRNVILGTQGRAGTASDPRVVSMMVADDGLAHLGVKMINLRLGDQHKMRIFGDVPQALAYARAHIEQKAADASIPHG